MQVTDFAWFLTEEGAWEHGFFLSARGIASRLPLSGTLPLPP